jgi:uncharacterized membrane protein
MFETEHTNDTPSPSDRRIQHRSNSEWSQIGLGKLLGPNIRMSIMGGNRMLFMDNGLKVRRVVLCG